MAKVERGRNGGIPPVTEKGGRKRKTRGRGEEVKMSQGLEIKLWRAQIFSGWDLLLLPRRIQVGVKIFDEKKFMSTLPLFRTRDEEILIKLCSTAAWWKTRSKVMMVLTFRRMEPIKLPLLQPQKSTSFHVIGSNNCEC